MTLPDVSFKRIRRILGEAIILIVTSLALVIAYDNVGPYVKRWLTTDKPPTPSVPAALPMSAIGQTLRVNNTIVHANQLGIVLVTSPTCPFCQQSMTFHSSVYKLAQANNIPFIVAVPNRDRANQYLKSAGLTTSSIVGWSDLNVRARGTPTIMFVDSRGIIKRLWVGRLVADKQTELITAVRNRDLSQPAAVSAPQNRSYLNFTSEQLMRIREQRSVSLIDVHDRPEFNSGHIIDAKNLPFVELQTRAPYELSRKDLQIVDCSSIRAVICTAAVERLSHSGFEVAALNDGAVFENFCQTTITTQ